jgi:hypothetical protein
MQRSCERTGGELSSGYLWQECRAGHAFLFIALEEMTILGAAVVRFDTWPNGTRLRGLGLCGKDMKRWWEPMRAEVIRRGREGGAVAWVDMGRKGLRKYLHDAKILGTVYEVRL